MHQAESNPPGLSKGLTPKLLQFFKCENQARRLELPYEIRLPVEVYARVCGTSSPSRSFREPVHLSAFLFASFPNAYESTIYLLLTEFEGRTVSYGPSFFLLDLWPKREARGP